MYVLQACSLLEISPPEGSLAPQGGFLTNLTGINLSDWAALVQDVVASLQALPPDLSSCLCLRVVNLLQLLEAATGVGFCHFCCKPDPYCGCVGSLSVGSPYVVEPDCRADSRVWSDLLLRRSDHSEYLHWRYAWIHGTSSRPHPPPPDFSIWSMPPLEASLPKGLPVSP